MAELITTLLEIYLLLGGTQSLLIVIAIGIAIVVYKRIEKIDNKLDLAKINQEATDYAIEKVIANGKGDLYAQHRQEKKDELLEDRKVLKGE